MKKFAFALTVTSGAAAVLTHQDAQASTQHAVQSGDSLWTVAEQYGTTVDAIKQANGLSNNMIFPGQTLTIGGSASNETAQSNAQTQNTTSYNVTTTQTSGNGHKVVAGESLDIIAAQYGVTVQDLMNANGMSSYLIHPNQTLQIPGQSGAVSTSNVNTAAAGGNGVQTVQTSTQTQTPSVNQSNLYTWGQCTWHVFNRRSETGQPISTYWWNASNWASAASSDGYTVNNAPQVGAIMQTTEGPMGHVAYVERVNPDGSILVSEMNYNTSPGQVGYRTIPGSLTSSYNYIH
ncbi:MULTISPECIES: LysM peptidoglycan-binding domain-containing protein [unclassified Staphylococcus]|uniref:LysM peptidoglycan-binding domain-containing protein n=1 Tax=unclassified Staphylococcus TaxID=91994 RepID=UPI0021D14DAA|nr:MULTISPECIES: LysM peptidoglycan-binding domain-containing protein [unclassified Staphylococcus]UXR78681.1 LysM peptidoglycan-binding domain-containing protein [Staphylococcus sp. IVB6227]UXR82841.1 LysM peptidoglycan-binding domain-containing protein [Staphylococcus sp. IVB6214]